MIELDEDALICDLAETYHIFNYKDLPLDLVGVLCCGLRENSRIKLKMAEQNIPLDSILLASIVDRLSLLVWKDTKDGQKNRNRPESMLNKLLERNKENNYAKFNSIEEYEEARKRILGEINGN